MSIDPQSEVENYLYPPVGYFWRWEDHGRVVAWSDGQTLGYLEEVQGVVDHLAPQGLPPMGALLLFLAACRRDWTGNRERIRGLLRGLVSPADRDWEMRMGCIQVVVTMLDEVQRVPPSRRIGVGQRAALARIVFEGTASPRPECTAVVSSLVGGRPSVDRWTQAPVVGHLSADLACLEMALGEFSAERAVWRLQTGMDGPPEAVPGDVSPKEEAIADMLTRLGADPEFALVSKFAQQLCAAVYVPRPVSEPDEQALGGISDVSNRGRLDRLLLTELANEPLVLAARVALNEALYLRHEMPPRAPATRRVVLLDTGIRTWGLPRIAVLATGLALQEGTALTTDSFVLNGQRFENVNMRTEEGLRQAMAAISPVASPYQALMGFLGELRLAGGDVEVVVVTARELALRPQMRAALAGAGRARQLVAGIDGDGRVEAWALGEFGRRSLFQCQLPVSERPKLRVRPLADLNEGRDCLPAIFERRPFPLRLPCTKVPTCAVWNERVGVVGVTHDRRLLLWEGVDRGAVQLADNLAERSVLAMRISESGPLLLVQGTAGEAVELRRYSLDGMTSESTTLPDTAEHVRWAALAVEEGEWRAVVAVPRQTMAFDMTGALLKAYPGKGGAADTSGLLWAQHMETGAGKSPGPVPETAIAQFVRARRSVMLHLEMVAVDESRQLCVAGRGNCWVLQFDEHAQALRFVRRSQMPARENRIPLRQLSPSRRRGYRILVGERGEVGVALDRRGLLHLYELDGGSLQMTIVTAQGLTAAVNQSCDISGPGFFRFFGQRIETHESWQQIRSLVRRLCG